MSKYVPDVSSHRWVIISPHRLDRPSGSGPKDVCPLCPGHESLTPPEDMRLGGGEANKPGWLVRVVPNKYAITDQHEVIIHSPDHKKDLEELPLSHINLIFNVYRQRYNFYRKRGQVIIFCNHGLHSGASLTHPHSQLVVIPSQINLDTLSQEPLNNIVTQNDFFQVYCPDFSQWPYEVWIVPKKQNTVFGDIGDQEIVDLAGIVKKMLHRLLGVYKKHNVSGILFGYNYYIYPKENWYLRIIPRFINRAGFELGTGLSVNIMDPTEAALELKGVDKRLTQVLGKLKKSTVVR